MSKKIHSKRRDFLFTATYTIGAVGVGATIWPLVDQMNPDSSVKALSTTEVDISNIVPGKSITVLEQSLPQHVDVLNCALLLLRNYILPVVTIENATVPK